MSSRLVAVFTPFENLADPRIERTRIHDLFELVVVALCGTIAGADTWADIERFGNERLSWLRTFLRLDFLYNQALYHNEMASQWGSRAAVGCLIDILAITTRGDVRSEVLKELFRIPSILALAVTTTFGSASSCKASPVTEAAPATAAPVMKFRRFKYVALGVISEDGMSSDFRNNMVTSS